MQRHIALAAGVLINAAVAASPLSPEASLSRALGETPEGMMRAPGEFSLAYTHQQALYVFNSPSGFIITSADTAMRPVLARGQGQFDADTLPCNVKMWLDLYAAEAEFAAGNAPAYTPAAATPGRHDIAPMLTTKWDQTDPYNTLCPTHRGLRTCTGCVATAMAQVMNFYQHPAQGSGSVSYLAETVGSTISADISKSTYNWELMKDTYNGFSDTEAEKLAVAQLMYDCGVATRMDYNLAAQGGSGTSSTYIPYALSKYFGYDGDCDMVYRDFYTQDEWNTIVYDELAQGRPVIYVGAAPTGGHCFVADGYRNDDMFHINWGWSGYCDGWFALSSLNPEGQGTGGHAGGYTIQQNILLGMTPTPAGKEQFTSVHVLGVGDFYHSRGLFGFTDAYGTLSLEGVTFSPGIEVVDSNGSSRFFIANDVIWEFNENTGTRDGYAVTPQGLAAGDYRVYPAYQRAGHAPRRMPARDSSRGALYLSVGANGSLAYFNNADAMPRVRIDRMTPTNGGRLYAGIPASLTLELSNPSGADYSSDGSEAVITDSRGKIITSVTLTPSISAGSRSSVSIPNVTLPEGVCTIRVTDSRNNKEWDGSPVEFSVFSPTNTSGHYLTARLELNTDTLTFTKPFGAVMSVTNSGTADYTAPLTLKIFSGTDITTADPEPIFAVTTEPQSVAVDAAVTNVTFTPELPLHPGSYIMALFDTDDCRLPYSATPFTVEDRSVAITYLRLPDSADFLQPDTPAELIFTVKPGTERGFDGRLALYVKNPADGSYPVREVVNFTRPDMARRTISLNVPALPEGDYLTGIDYYLTDGTSDLSTPVENSPLDLRVGNPGDSNSIGSLSALTVTPGNCRVDITGMTAGTPITLTDAAGRRLAHILSPADGTATLTVPAHGLYILTISTRTLKLTL